MAPGTEGEQVASGRFWAMSSATRAPNTTASSREGDSSDSPPSLRSFPKGPKTARLSSGARCFVVRQSSPRPGSHITEGIDTCASHQESIEPSSQSPSQFC